MLDDGNENTLDAAMAEQTAEVVSAYVSNNPLPRGELPGLIAAVYGALASLSANPVEEEKPEPAVNPRRSVKSDRVICLECGKGFKSLKRHIRTYHDLMPEDYRAKWNLSADYPMVAPEYAEKRSSLAKTMGLGRKPGTASKK